MSSIPTDERYTPKWVLDIVCKIAGGRANLADVAVPDVGNPTDAAAVIRKSKDALKARWPGSGWTVYCNPPYSRGNLWKWSEKARKEALLGVEVVLLTPADTSTQWCQFLFNGADEVCLLGRRVGFVDPETGKELPGAKFGSALWYLGPRRRTFRRITGEHGTVLPLPGCR